MARRILGRAPGIGKRWPHRALNFLPAKQLWKYLEWKSGGRGVETAFQLGKALTDCRRILVLLPDSFQDILVILPVLQSLAQDLPDLELLLLGDREDAPFLAALFGPDKVAPMDPEGLYWGEPHFRELERLVQAFQPDMALDLKQSTPPLLTYLLRTSQAPLRVGYTAVAPFPSHFANIHLRPVDPPNPLRQALMTAALWNFSQSPVTCKWSRLKPGPDNLREAAARLTAKGLRPESTRLFLWQDAASPYQQEIFRAAVTERSGPGESTSLAILVAPGQPFAGIAPTPEMTSGIPCLEAETTGLLLGFFDQTARSIGINGPLLHLAGLTDTDVEAHFGAEDAPWDTSFLNPRMKVRYRT